MLNIWAIESNSIPGIDISDFPRIQLFKNVVYRADGFATI